jgi:hypothetical protein
MSDIKRCIECGILDHIDNMKTCIEDGFSYCSMCDGKLVLIKGENGEFGYLQKELMESFIKENSHTKWKII